MTDFATLPAVNRSASRSSQTEARAIGQRCVLTLFLAMSMGLIAGLLSCGPIPLDLAARHHADSTSFGGLEQGLNVLGDLALLSVGAWGLRKTRRVDRKPTALRPWTWLYGSIIGAALAHAIDELVPSIAGLIAIQFLAANCAALMMLCLLAERIDARLGLRRFCMAACAAAGAAVASWCVGASTNGSGDARALLFLLGLPVLLVPAGALGVAGAPTGTSSWAAILVLWTAALVFEIADARILQWTGGSNGHLAMQLAFACTAVRPWRKGSPIVKAVQSQRSNSA